MGLRAQKHHAPQTPDPVLQNLYDYSPSQGLEMLR